MDKPTQLPADDPREHPLRDPNGPDTGTAEPPKPDQELPDPDRRDRPTPPPTKDPRR